MIVASDAPALTKLDLNAAALARRWGVTLTRSAVLVPASPCQRRWCGGSVLGSDCMLCARPHGRDSAADLERELARQSGLTGLAKVALTGD